MEIISVTMAGFALVFGIGCAIVWRLSAIARTLDDLQEQVEGKPSDNGADGGHEDIAECI